MKLIERQITIPAIISKWTKKKYIIIAGRGAFSGASRE